jgi:putative membrane protein
MINYEPREWRHHLFDLKGSMIREITCRLVTCVLWALAVSVAHHALFVPHGLSLAMPETAHSLVGVALGLLLVFRTNSSYDRFWEGRKQWGAIVNESRNMGRSASVYLASAPDLIRPILLWTSAFSWATMYRLRGKAQLGAIASDLPPEEVNAVLATNHTPLAVAGCITRRLAEARRRGVISDHLLVALDQNVQLLVDYMGACERIRNTRIPFAYMVHLRRALILYCFTLPFALLGRFGWGSSFAVLFVAYVLYGIEEIGVEIEDPFGEDVNDLPVAEFCAAIEGTLRGIAAAGEDGSPPA